MIIVRVVSSVIIVFGWTVVVHRILHHLWRKDEELGELQIIVNAVGSL